MTDIRLRVLADDLTTDLGPLLQAYNIEWLDEGLDVGAGRFTIPNDSPSIIANGDILNRDHVVIIEDDDNPGWDGFAFLVRKRNRKRGDRSDPVVIGGEGVLELLRSNLVEYARGFELGIPTDERPFGWMAIDYDDTVAGWTSGGFDLGRQDNPTFYNPSLPESWPVPTARWVAPSAPSPNVNGGTGHTADDYWYYRDRLLGPYVGTAVLFIAADNAHQTYFNGSLIVEGTDRTQFEQQQVTLTGDDVLASEIYNGPLGSTNNPTALLWAIAVVDDEGEIQQVLFQSTSARGRVNAFPGAPPGVTKGEILATLFDEGKARGWLAPITRGFDKTTDSRGVPWADEILWVCQVGNDSVLSVGERLRETGVDIWMGPDFVFHAAQHRGTRRQDTVDGAVPAFAIERVKELESDSEDELINALSVRSDDAWFRVGNPPTGQRREAFLTLGLQPTVASALVLAEHVLEQAERSRQVVRFTTHSSFAPVPYVDVFPMDEVLAPAVDPDRLFDPWTPEVTRVDTIAARVTVTGEIDYAWEVEILYPGDVILIEDEVAVGNSVQRVEINGTATSGRFKLCWNGEESGWINWNSSEGSLKTAIEATPGIDSVTISNRVGGFGSAEGGPLIRFDVEFSGPAVCCRPQPLFTICHSSIVSSPAPSVTELSAGSGYTVALTTERDGLALRWEGPQP